MHVALVLLGLGWLMVPFALYSLAPDPPAAPHIVDRWVTSPRGLQCCLTRLWPDTCAELWPTMAGACVEMPKPVEGHQHVHIRNAGTASLTLILADGTMVDSFHGWSVDAMELLPRTQWCGTSRNDWEWNTRPCGCPMDGESAPGWDQDFYRRYYCATEEEQRLFYASRGRQTEE